MSLHPPLPERIATALRLIAAAAALLALAAAGHAQPAAAIATETVANPYGLQALWRQGDWITRGTLLVMVVMSVGSWYVIVAKVWEQHALLRSAAAAARSFWAAGSVPAGIAALDEASAFRFIAQRAQAASEQHDGARIGQLDAHAWVALSVQRAVDTIHGRLQGGLAFLATVGSTAPFVGLFGTTFGVINAFQGMASAGAGLAAISAGISEALITTGVGIGVAVLGVWAFNYFNARIAKVREEMASSEAEFMDWANKLLQNTSAMAGK